MTSSLPSSWRKRLSFRRATTAGPKSNSRFRHEEHEQDFSTVRGVNRPTTKHPHTKHNNENHKDNHNDDDDDVVRRGLSSGVHSSMDLTPRKHGNENTPPATHLTPRKDFASPKRDIARGSGTLSSSWSSRRRAHGPHSNACATPPKRSQQHQPVSTAGASAGASDGPAAMSHTPSRSTTTASPQGCCSRSDAAAALDAAGNQLLEQGHYDMAMTTYARALQLKQQSMNEQQQQNEERSSDSTVDTAAGGTIWKSVASPASFSSPNQPPSSSKTTTPANHHLLASVATSMNNISYVQQKTGNASPQTLLQTYQDSLRMKHQVYGRHTPHSSIGKTLNNLASVHFGMGEHKKALRCYQEALDILKAQLGDSHLDVATVYSNLGDVYRAWGSRHEEATACYQRALSIRWERLGDKDAKVVRLLEKVAAMEMKDELALSNATTGISLEKLEDELDATKLHNLQSSVQADLTYLDSVKRTMALDMVKDKLRILRGMRDIDKFRIEDAWDEGMEEEPRTPTTPLSPVQRNEALSSVRKRLAHLKEAKGRGGS